VQQHNKQSCQQYLRNTGNHPDKPATTTSIHNRSQILLDVFPTTHMVMETENSVRLSDNHDNNNGKRLQFTRFWPVATWLLNSSATKKFAARSYERRESWIVWVWRVGFAMYEHLKRIGQINPDQTNRSNWRSNREALPSTIFSKKK